MSQFLGPDKSTSVGRGQRFEIEAETETDEGERWLPGPDDHRGANTQRRDGCLVQSGEENRQECSLWSDSVAHQRRDQGRGKSRALPRAVHVPSRESLSQSVRKQRRYGDFAPGEGRRRLESLLWSPWRGTRRRICHALWNWKHLSSNDVSHFF